jgi:hypothetical protein
MRRGLQNAAADAEEEVLEDVDINMHDTFIPFAPIEEEDAAESEVDLSQEDVSDSDESDNDDDDMHSSVLSFDDDLHRQLQRSRPSHKHSPSLPSALSPYRATTSRLTSPSPSYSRPGHSRPSYVYRHEYPHRGMSRLALCNMRYMWNARKNEWDRWHEEVVDADVARRYGGTIWAPRPSPGGSWRSLTIPATPPGLTPPPSARPLLALSIPATPPGLPLPVPKPVKNEPPPVESMFPRVGDLLALRRPQACMAPDWIFRRVPLYRIHKALFAYEMHQRVAVPCLPSGSSPLLTAFPTSPSNSGTVSSSESMPSASSVIMSPSSSSSLNIFDGEREGTEDGDDWGRGGSPDSDATLVDEECLIAESPDLLYPDHSDHPESNWLLRWHVISEIFTADGRACVPAPPSPGQLCNTTNSDTGLDKGKGKGKAVDHGNDKGKSPQGSTDQGSRFDTLMRMMVEDAIDAGRVEVRGRKSPGKAGQGKQTRRAKQRFFVPDMDMEEELEQDQEQLETTSRRELSLDSDSDSDDEADNYDYGAPVGQPVFARIASQLETRRLVMDADAGVTV